MGYFLKYFDYKDKEQVYQLVNDICRHYPEKLKCKKYKKLIDSYNQFYDLDMKIQYGLQQRS